jgi:integrase
VARPKRANGDGSIYYDKARGVYRVTVVLSDGRRLSRRTKTDKAADAEALLVKLRTEADEIGGPRPAPGTRSSWTVASWFDYWRANVVANRKGRHGTGLSSSSQRREVWLADDIRRTFDGVALRRLSAEDVELWLSARAMGVDVARKPWGDNACKQARNLLARAIDEAVARRHVADNVARRAGIPGHAAPTDPRFAMDPADAAAVYKTALASDKAANHVVALMLATGMRPGEARRVQRTDVDVKARTLRIPKSKTDTGVRTIALNPNAWAVIRRRFDTVGALGAENDYLFAGDLGPYVSEAALIDNLAEIANGLGVTVGDPPRPPRPHELRHTVASILIDADVSPQQVADMLGDRIETILRTYRHKLREVAGDVAAAPLAAVYGAA